MGGACSTYGLCWLERVISQRLLPFMSLCFYTNPIRFTESCSSYNTNSPRMYFLPIEHDTIPTSLTTGLVSLLQQLVSALQPLTVQKQGKANSSDTVTSAILHNFDDLDTILLSRLLLFGRCMCTDVFEEPCAEHHVVWDVRSDVVG
jgi:hypothetical protein